MRQRTPFRLRKLPERLGNLWRRPWADKWLLTQVYLLLGVTRLARTFGPHKVESPGDARAAHGRKPWISSASTGCRP